MDLIVLNEVDWGINRTLFRNVTAELAEALSMNYAYGVEFVEVDPVTMGIDDQVILREVKDAYVEPGQNKAEMLEYVRQVMRPDPSRYRGLRGTAIFSRYALDNVRVVPFKFQGTRLVRAGKTKDFGVNQGRPCLKSRTPCLDAVSTTAR